MSGVDDPLRDLGDLVIKPRIDPVHVSHVYRVHVHPLLTKHQGQVSHHFVYN